MIIYNTPEGMIAVLSNGRKFAEYSVISLFRELYLPYFVQLIGFESPKSFFEEEYEIKTLKIDSKNNLYTVWNKALFNYSFPIPQGAKRLIIAPSEEGCKKILMKLTGFSTWDEVNKFFYIYWLDDNCPGSKRKGLRFEQKYEWKEGARGAFGFLQASKHPVFFKGGKIGDTDIA